MKPIIGVTANLAEEKTLSVHHINYDRIIEAGGTPVVLPVTSDKETIESLVNLVDGLVLTGGADVSPILFNEEPHQQLGEISPGRDAFEIELLKVAIEKKVPLFTICRGTQMLNVACHGTIYQDITSQVGEGALQHKQEAVREYRAHHVDIEKDSKLAEIMKDTHIGVNTFHHQSIKDVGEGLKAVAHSSDGIIEAVESTSDHYMLGVQWHPEYLKDEGSENLFKTFIEACQK